MNEVFRPLLIDDGLNARHDFGVVQKIVVDECPVVIAGPGKDDCLTGDGVAGGNLE